MKAVHHKVNIVPVIAKADTLTRAECIRLKKRVRLKISDAFGQHSCHGYVGNICGSSHSRALSFLHFHRLKIK